MMNRRARELGLRDTHYANPIGLDEPGNYSSAADLVKLALVLRQHRVLPRDDEHARRRRCTRARARARSSTATRSCARCRAVNGVKTGHTNEAGYILVGSATRGGVTLVSACSATPSEAARDADSLALLRYGLATLPPRDAGARAARSSRVRALRYRDEPRRPRRRAHRAPRVARRGERLTTIVRGAPARDRGPAGRRRTRSGPIHVRQRGRVVARVAARHRATPCRGRGARQRARRLARPVAAPLVLGVLALCSLHLACSCARGARRRRRPRGTDERRMIITVTLNAAIDKSLSVPNFRLGRRHRTVEQTTMPGGKGVNVARTLKTLGQPVIATGLRGRPDGHAHRRAADRASRSSTTSSASARSRARTRRCYDPTNGEQTEINERGPAVSASRDGAVPRQAALPRARRRHRASSPARCRAASTPRSTPSLIRELRKLGVMTIVDTDGEPLRHAVRAEPDVISPNVLEAEELVGHEFNDEEDRVIAVREMVALGAREAIMTVPDGCVACVLVDGGRDAVPRAGSSRARPSRRVGAGDAFLAGYVAARYDGRDARSECLRFGVACGAESTSAPRRRARRPARGRAAASARSTSSALAEPAEVGRYAATAIALGAAAAASCPGVIAAATHVAIAVPGPRSRGVFSSALDPRIR